MGWLENLTQLKQDVRVSINPTGRNSFLLMPLGGGTTLPVKVYNPEAVVSFTCRQNSVPQSGKGNAFRAEPRDRFRFEF